MNEPREKRLASLIASAGHSQRPQPDDGVRGMPGVTVIGLTDDGRSALGCLNSAPVTRDGPANDGAVRQPAGPPR